MADDKFIEDSFKKESISKFGLSAKRCEMIVDWMKVNKM